jgi:hypothetical protein
MKSDNKGMFGFAATVKNDHRMNLLLNADWEQISKALKSRTVRRLQVRCFRGQFGGVVPGGHEVEDFIQAAIAETFTEVAKWDCKQVSLVKHLWKIIARHIKRYGSRHESRREKRSTTNPDEATSHVADVSQAQQTCYPEPEELAAERREAERILEKFRGHRDYEIIEVIITKGVYMPLDIAAKLDISVDEVNNAKKRLKRNEFMCSLLRQKKARKKSP